MSPQSLLIDASSRLALLGGALVAALFLTPMVELGWRGVAAALAAYGAIAVFVLRALPGHAPHRRFGAANALTLTRAAYVALLLGVVVDGVALDAAARWMLAGTGLLVLLLDGADGWVARRTGFASAFGARFDMEVDALFVFALTALVARISAVGSWVLIGGLLRYAFVVMGVVWPALAAPLPPSFRRKAICVVQIGVLLAALIPPTGTSAPLLCFGGLLLLIYSFVADGVQLAGRRLTPRLTT